MLPICSSQSPKAGDKVLAGHHLKMQDIRKDQALRILLRGSSKYFIIVITDAGYQFVGKLNIPQTIYVDLQKVVEREKAIFLGTFLPLIIH